jgi:hypothetical protein
MAWRLFRVRRHVSLTPNGEKRPQKCTGEDQGSLATDKSLPKGSSTTSDAKSRPALRSGFSSLAHWWLRQSDQAKAGYIGALATAIVAPVVTVLLTSTNSGSPPQAALPTAAPSPFISNSHPGKSTFPSPSLSLATSPTSTQPASSPTSAPTPASRQANTEQVVVPEGVRVTALEGQVAIALDSTYLSDKNGWLVYGLVTETSTGATLPLQGAPVGYQATFGKRHRYVVIILCAATGCPDDLTAQFEVSRR